MIPPWARRLAQGFHWLTPLSIDFDYAASTQARMNTIGGPNPDYGVLSTPDDDGNRSAHWGNMWHYTLSRLVVAARVDGLRPLDGPFGDSLASKLALARLPNSAAKESGRSTRRKSRSRTRCSVQPSTKSTIHACSRSDGRREASGCGSRVPRWAHDRSGVDGLDPRAPLGLQTPSPGR